MRAQGIGEILTPIPCGRTFPLLLIQPCEGLSTKEIFTADHQQNPMSGSVERVMEALKGGNLSMMEENAVNMLQTVSVLKKPVLQTAIHALYAAGASFARMTGSGSVVFGAFETEEAAQKASETLKSFYSVCILTETAL